jgi:transposase
MVSDKSVRRYPPKVREEALELFDKLRPGFQSDTAALAAVCEKLGISSVETARKWVYGRNLGQSSDSDQDELARLRAENEELRRINRVLRATHQHLLNDRFN